MASGIVKYLATVIILSSSIRFSSSSADKLFCFQCSDLVGFNGCPTSSETIQNWVDKPGKYTEIGVPTEYSCVLGYDAGEKLWHQVSYCRRVEEPFSLVRQSCSGGVMSNPLFPNMPQASTGKYGC